MDVQNLRENHPKLIAYMKESGYNTCYIARVKREIDRILSEASSKGWASYTDIYLKYAQESSSPSYLHEKLTYLGIIKNFDERAEYPDGRRRQKVVERGKYNRLTPEFKAIIDLYRTTERLRGKKENTIYHESHSAATFLLALQQNGISKIYSAHEPISMT